jgi:hypothetical protein
MKEALKLALEALEGLYISSFTMPNSPISIAITAIKAALAQQEPWCMKMNGCKTKCADCPDEPAQEPITVLTSAGYIADEDDDIQVYQRPWVGLTFAEICDAEVVATDEFNNFSELKFARAIEAKLKEKNA